MQADIGPKFDPEKERNARLKLGDQGISFNYVDVCITLPNQYCRSLLEREKYDTPFSDAELRTRLLGETQNFRSYSGYVEGMEREREELAAAIKPAGRMVVENIDSVAANIRLLGQREAAKEEDKRFGKAALIGLKTLLDLIQKMVMEQRVVAPEEVLAS